MSKCPTVSVLLPVRDGDTSLPAAVDSILAQTETRLELLVIDDGSDNPVSDVLSARAHDPRLRILRQPRQGIVAALNAGIAEARGDYLARMDADDWCVPNRIKTQLTALQANPDWDAVSCLVEHGKHRDEDEGLVCYLNWVNGLVAPDDIARHRFIESPLVHPTVLFRRRLIDDVGTYRDFDGPEDYDLWLRWLEAGIRIGKVSEALYRWNDLPDRLTHRDPRYRQDAFYRCKTPYLARWLERHNPHHPEVLIWGAGRITRGRATLLQEHGVRITGYIDIDPNKIGANLPQGPVLHPDELPPPGSEFVLSYVGSRGAREKIGRALDEKDYKLGRDYLFVA